MEGIDFDDKQQVADALMEQSARIMNDKPENNETNMSNEKSKYFPIPKPVVRIDPETMLLAGLYESISKAHKETGIRNITRAIQNRTLAGGYYWCLEENKSTFQPADKKGAGRPSTTKAEKKPKVKPKTKGPMEQFAEEYEQPVSETFTPEPLSTYSDDELMTELDRRGFEGELSRRVVFTIGAK